MIFRALSLVQGLKKIVVVEPLIGEAHAAKMGMELAAELGFMTFFWRVTLSLLSKQYKPSHAPLSGVFFL